MYIVAIAWLYVVLMMALTEPHPVAGVLTFLAYGVAPLALLLWLMGTPMRRRRAAAREALAEPGVHQVVPGDDGAHPKSDQ